MIVRPLMILSLLSLLAAAGCQPAKSGPKRAAVAGHVTLDGTDIDQGSIAFIPTGDTTGMTAGGTIRSGNFSIPVEKGPVIGTNRVEIHSSRKSGRQVPAPFGQPGQMTDEMVEAVPAGEYRSVTIAPGENTLEFNLTSK